MLTIDIAIPVLNEESYIQGCLNSVRAFEMPEDVRCTIYILDGGSRDNTRAIAEDYAQRYANIVVMDNPGRIQSCALNTVIRQGQGDYILRLDAHASYPQDYIRLCLETAERTGADNLGGVVITQPGASTYSAGLVQALTTHRFGVGNSDFRLDATEKAVDTVPYGFFRREIFERIGFYDERLVRAQDYEINRRIIASGRKVWLNPDIRIYYHNQPDLYSFYKKQITKEAPYNAYLWWVAPYAFAPRHAITGLFSVGIISGFVLWGFASWVRLPFGIVMMLYGILALIAAFQQAKRYGKPMYFFLLPLCFFMYHFLHGLGVLWGLVRLVTRTAPVQQVKEPWPDAGRYRAWPKK